MLEAKSTSVITYNFEMSEIDFNANNRYTILNY
jgi:hypothetical protein